MPHTFPYLVKQTWRTSVEPVEIRAPFDQSVVGTTFLASASEIDEAISAAQSGFAHMKALPAFRRTELLHGIASGIKQRAEEIAQVLAAEAGKPLKAARQEVERSTFTFTTAAEEAKRIGGEILPMDVVPTGTGRMGLVRRFPIGPISAITPFNFPLNLVAHKVAPALAAGNSILVKPAPQTPLTALLLGEIALSAGLPEGALQIIPASVENAQALVTDERIKMLSFTGSATVGWQLKNKAGKKKVALELGGNAGVVIHSDGDLDFAALRCVQGGFGYSGQTCISVQRILVHRPAREAFLERFLPQVKQLKTGNPLDETTDVGPLVSLAAAERVAAWIQEAVAAGASLLTGGSRSGSMVEPTVLTGTNPRMRVNCEEVFGPVVAVEAYDDFDEAIAQLNDGPYGLQAGIFTKDLQKAFRAHEVLEVGGVMVGDVPTFRIDHMPYGGIKDSGFGREGLRSAIEEMTEPKLMVVKTS
ncbi:MAG: aldehyde dehydrogenase family protein [Blastocatellia bacterium]|nr:aldehyde dehydrogenase family protein [Blastocatellia bacterium]